MEPPEQNVGFHITTTPDEAEIRPATESTSPDDQDGGLRMLLVGNLAPHRADQVNWQQSDQIHSVDKHTYADLFERLAPVLHLTVRDHLGSDRPRLNMTLTFRSLKDMHPEGIVSQVPALKAAVEVRSQLQSLIEQTVSLDDLGKNLQKLGMEPAEVDQLVKSLKPGRPAPKKSSPRKSKPAGSSSLDSLLQMVDVGGEEEPEPETGGSIADMLGRAVSDSGTAGFNRSKAESLMQDMDRSIGKQLNAVLHDAEFQALESAWRGLRELIGRINFRKDISLDVITVPKEEVVEALYFQVLMPVHEGKKLPYRAVILDASYDNTGADIDQLKDLSEIGSSAGMPVLANVADAFFGNVPTLSRIGPLWQHLNRPEYVPWRALKEQEAVRYLTLVPNRFLLRYPYGTQNPVQGFPFTEATGDSAFCWGGGTLLVAMAMAQSFAETGRHTHIDGLQGTAILHDFPTRDVKGRQCALVHVMEQMHLDDFAKAGFVALWSRPNQDKIGIHKAPTVRGMAGTDAEAGTLRLHSTLPGLLVSTQLMQEVLAFEKSLQSEEEPTEIETRLQRKIAHVLGTGPEQQEIVVGAQEQAGSYRVGLKLNIPANWLGAEAELVFMLDFKL